MSATVAERDEKRRRVAAVREGAGAEAVLLTSHEALSWYLGGVRTHVSLAGPPVLAVRAAHDGDVLFVSANEADRLIAEELGADDGARVVRVPWHRSVGGAAGEAPGAVGEAALGDALRAARAELLPVEADRYRTLGREVAEVLTDVARAVRPETPERHAAAIAVRGLVERGIDPLVVLVAGADRLSHRHPLPTPGPLGARAMIVVCGRRRGLIANATRWVGRAGIDDERILAVEAGFLAATRPGARLDRVFAAGCRGYEEAGFAADEWERHHQGGPTGYAGRDPRATAETLDVVSARHAFAWNPSAPGVKVEDTVIVSETGVEVVTSDAHWPVTTVAGLARPLARPYD